MKLTVDDGKDLAALLGRIPACIQRALEIIHKLPDGKLLTTQSLATRSSVSVGTLQKSAAHPAVTPFRIKTGSRVLWANAKTIIAAQAQLA